MQALRKYVESKGEKWSDAADKRVATVAVMHGDHMLLGKRRDNGKFTVPGGHANDGEHPHAAALRELNEEAGIEPRHGKLEPLGKSKTVTNDKGETVEVHPFKFTVEKRPGTTMREDPDGEVHRWNWVNTSKGIPKDVRENLHVPLDRNVLMERLGHCEEKGGDMKKCGELDKYMKKKGMDPNKRHDPEEAHENIATDDFTDEQIEDDGIKDKEGPKSKKASKDLDKFQRMKK